MNDKQIKILNQAVETYGKANQVDKAIEEMSELTKALLKHRQNNGSVDDIAEEIADVYIIIGQLLIIYNISNLDDYIDFKTKRLEHRLNNNGGD